MAAQPGNYNIRDALNRWSRVASRAHLGDLLADIIDSINGINQRMDSTGAAVNATVTQTFTGTITAGNTFSATFTNAAITGLPVTISSTVVAGDTLTTIAARLAALANANAVLAAAYITGSPALGVVTWRQPGTIGNSTVVTGTGTGTLTGTIANSGAMASGTGTVGNTNRTANNVPTLESLP